MLLTSIEIILNRVDVLLAVLVEELLFVNPRELVLLDQAIPDVAPILLLDSWRDWVVADVEGLRELHVHLLQLLVDDQPLVVLRSAAEDVALIHTCLLKDSLDALRVGREA